ncbi:hypothetical protein DICPUDRAFT_5960, partial [Dictyostelium purpureum]
KKITSKIIYKEIIHYCIKEEREEGKWKYQLALVCKLWFSVIKKLVNHFVVNDFKSLEYLEKRLIIIHEQQEGQKRLDRFNHYFTSNNMIYTHRNNNYFSILNGITKLIFKDLDNNLIIYSNNNNSNNNNNDSYYKIISSIRELIKNISSIKQIKFLLSDTFFVELQPSSFYLESLKIKSSNKITFPLESVAETLLKSINLKTVSLNSFCYCSNPMVFLGALIKSKVQNFNLKIDSHGNLSIDHLLEKNFSSFKISGAKLYLERFNMVINQPSIEYIDSPLHFMENEPMENIITFCDNLKNNKTIRKLSISGDIGLPLSSTISRLFSNVFSFNQTITSLSISKLKIISEGFFQSLIKHPTLTQLELTDGCIDESLLISLSNLLCEPSKTKIEYLSIRNNNISDINSSIYMIFLKSTTLKGIDLSNNNFTVHQTGKMFEALSNNDYIYKLDFSNSCNFSTNHLVKSLNNYINNSKKLLAINLYNCYLINQKNN